jgi:large-conductance mechanosensitive channel
MQHLPRQLHHGFDQFLIIAFILLQMVEISNWLKRADPPPPPEASTTEALLKKIRDALVTVEEKKV